MACFITQQGFYYSGNKISESDIEVSERPAERYYWNFATNQWQEDTNKHWEEIRQKRNELLFESDWTQLLDSPLTEQQKVEWTIYRQQLRNLPEIFVNCEAVIFPIPPQ